MKILHVIYSLEIGGAQRLLSDLLPLQVQQGLDVTLGIFKEETTSFSNRIADAGIKTILLEKPRYKNLFALPRLRNTIREYDVVHVHLFPSIYWVALASIGLDIKLFYTEHSTTNRRRSKPFLRSIEQFVYGRYNKIISISKQTQDALQIWLKQADSRFVVVNNGIDTSKFKQQQEVVPKSLIMVSRFAASKDQETLIRAMQYIDIDVTLTLVGDGENINHCKEIAKSLGVNSRIRFLGARSDVAELISQSYIGVQSSNWEGFGLTAVEIMAAGKPVIASNVDGLKQVVEGAGVIFEKGNEHQLADCINKLIADKQLYDTTAELCLTRSSLYDISLMSKRYIELYEKQTSDS